MVIHVMKKIADWIVDHEKDAAADCTVPDEVIDEWLETIEERKKRMKEHGKTDTAQYEMLCDLEKKVQEIKKIRSAKCRIRGD